MSSVNSTYQTFKDALAVLAGDGALPQRVAHAQTVLGSLRAGGAVLDQTTLQSRFERLLDANPSDNPARLAQEILVLFEEVSAVYHVWMSQAGRSC